VYNMKLPLPALHEDQNRNATAGEILRGYCASRGFTLVGGRPDEVRAGRLLLKDYINGKLLYCNAPEGYKGPLGAARLGEDHMVGYGAGAIVFKTGQDDTLQSNDNREDDPLAAAVLNDMMETLGLDNSKKKERLRAEHKYQKKGKKEKGRVKYKDSGVNTVVGGQGFLLGKRGGLMPANVQAQVRSSITDE
jgi:large subunit GTPase 1